MERESLVGSTPPLSKQVDAFGTDIHEQFARIHEQFARLEARLLRMLIVTIFGSCVLATLLVRLP